MNKDGKAFVVTDNDGVDDAPGETQLLRLDSWRSLFGRGATLSSISRKGPGDRRQNARMSP